MFDLIYVGVVYNYMPSTHKIVKGSYKSKTNDDPLKPYWTQSNECI